MKESINGAWLLGIVMVFMSIFIAYISISINYSNAYQMRTRMVTIIEQYQGLTYVTVDQLEKVRSAYNYNATGPCREGVDGPAVGVLNGDVHKNPTVECNYCVTRELRRGEIRSNGTVNGEDKYYYDVEVFFGFGLPVLGNLFTFRVGGETNAIFYPSNSDLFGR